MQDVVHCRTQSMFLSMETLGVWHHILSRVVSQDHESWFWNQVPIPLYLHIYLPVWDYWICAPSTQEWTRNTHPNAPTSNDGMTWHDNIVSVWWDIRLWHDCLNRALRSETFLSWALARDRGLGFALPSEKTYEIYFLGTLKFKNLLGITGKMKKGGGHFKKLAFCAHRICFRLYPPNTLRNFL